MKKKLIELKGETEKSTITAGDFNTPLSKTDRTSKQQKKKSVSSKYIEYLNNTLNQLDSIDIYRILHDPQWNTHYFQVHMKHLSSKIIFWAIKQITIHLKGFKSCKIYSLATVELNCKSIIDI